MYPANLSPTSIDPSKACSEPFPNLSLQEERSHVWLRMTKWGIMESEEYREP